MGTGGDNKLLLCAPNHKAVTQQLSNNQSKSLSVRIERSKVQSAFQSTCFASSLVGSSTITLGLRPYCRWPLSSAGEDAARKRSNRGRTKASVLPWIENGRVSEGKKVAHACDFVFHVWVQGNFINSETNPQNVLLMFRLERMSREHKNECGQVQTMLSNHGSPLTVDLELGFG